MRTTTPTEKLIDLTETAAEQIKSLLAQQPENGGRHLRVFVEKGGCSGMQYGMVFDEKREGDIAAQSHGVTVLIDPFSADYLEGMVVDFSESPPEQRLRQIL